MALKALQGLPLGYTSTASPTPSQLLQMHGACQTVPTVAAPTKGTLQQCTVAFLSYPGIYSNAASFSD